MVRKQSRAGPLYETIFKYFIVLLYLHNNSKKKI